MKFIIDRTTWLRGEGWEKSYLVRETDGKMCCLGQIGVQCSIPQDDMVAISNPASIKEVRHKWPEPLRPLSGDSLLCSRMMKVNDREFVEDHEARGKFTDEEREANLIELASAHGIELEFIN